MKTTVLLSAVAAVAFACGGLGAAAVAAVDEPAGDTIVEVTGDAANGFEIQHYDGTAEFPPTDSEAAAECSEYDTRVARVRCRTEVRTWYRDLADLQQALNWAHANGG
jgi:ABC-type sugar transport system substrate-binding protein